jgi:hypothetical protein
VAVPRTTLWPRLSRDKKSSGKRVRLFLIVTIGTSALALDCCAALFLSRCQPPGCTKQLFEVEIAWPVASA